MTTLVSMLRGINVSGQRAISMVELRSIYEGLGHTDVITYIQSGNVVFTTARHDTAELGDEIRGSIARELGHDVTVVLRTGDQMGGVIDRNPFLPRGANPKALHVTFLSDHVDPARLGALAGIGYAPDEFELIGDEIHLHCPVGYGNTKLHNTFWERRLGVPATTRNWNTVTRLFTLAGG